MTRTILVGAGLLLASLAQAAAPVYLNLGQAQSFTLTTGRSVVVTCSGRGGTPSGNRIPLAQGGSTTLDVQFSGFTTVYCNVRPPQPPVPQPPQPPIPQPPQPPLPPPGPGPGPGPIPPVSRTEVLIYPGSDNCTGTVRGYAQLIPGQDIGEQCRAQLGTGAQSSAWSIRVNMACINIPDTDALSACSQVSIPQAQSNTQVTFFSGADNCTGRVSATKIVSAYRGQAEQCMDLSRTGEASRSAWSVRVADQCLNIPDTDVMSACLSLRLPTITEPGAADLRIYSGSDSCTGSVSAVGVVRADQDPLDQCTNLTRMTTSNSAWSISVNGACTNIPDTDVASACMNVRLPSRYGYRQVVFYPGSDNCTGAVSTSAYFDPRFSTFGQCQSLRTAPGASRSVWSVRVDDNCINVPDTDLVSACASLRL